MQVDGALLLGAAVGCSFGSVSYYMNFALRNVFRKVEISEGGPWLYSSFVPRAESQAKGYELIEAIFEWEQFQIEKGFIQGLGLRAIAFK
jgi:hypothetical protein